MTAPIAGQIRKLVMHEHAIARLGREVETTA